MRPFRDFILVITAAAVLGLATYLTFTAAGWLNRGASLHLWSTPTVIREVQSLSDLVTVKYVMEKVEMLEDAKWYGESHVLLLAHGIVKAGIDLKRLKPGDVTVSGKSITIHLPPPELTDAYLDDRNSKVIDHTTGLLRTFDKDLEQNAREEAVLDIRAAAVQNGILNDAGERAQLELALFLHQAGYQEVKFEGGKPAVPQAEGVSHF